MFVFTRDGKASVQVMYRTAQSGSNYAQGGYEASYGTYHVDDSSTFRFHIDGALVRTLIGKDLKRHYQISGNRLIVKSTDPNEHWKVVWGRY
jgi:Lipocalin-like domain